MIIFLSSEMEKGMRAVSFVWRKGNLDDAAEKILDSWYNWKKHLH